MSALITTIHIIICFILIIAVLLQSGKSADLAGAFGGIGSQTVFGPRGAGSILSRVTTISAILFMVTSMGLWILSAKGTKSVVKGEETQKKETTAVTETKKETQQQKAVPTEKKAAAEKQKQEKKQQPSETENKD